MNTKKGGLPYVNLGFMWVMLSLYRPFRPLGLREVEAPTFSPIRLTDGSKVTVSPTCWPLCTPRKILGTRYRCLVTALDATVYMHIKKNSVVLVR
jgi:hypothetical protein